MPEPFELTVAQAARQIREGSLSPVTLMESLLERSDRMEPSLRVWVTLDRDAAMDGAAGSARELDRRGPKGPLHGVPVAVKDIFYTKGVRTTAGSPIYADFVPDFDAASVALLKQAGAIMMGKTVTTEFACGDPPPTRNPWNADHTPAGSSSGSAVGVAARLFPTALGSQTGGSVLRPAAFNGIVGLKPSYGRISRHGVIPVAWSLDTMGMFARTVEDTALMLNVMAGHDENDPVSSKEPVQDYVAGIGCSSAPKIGVVRERYHDRAEPEMRESIQSVVDTFANAGANVEDFVPETSFDTIVAAHRIIMNTEGAAVHEADFGARPDDYSPNVRSLIEAGLLTSAVSYLQAQRVRRSFHGEMVEATRRFDVLLMPTAPGPAPKDLSTTGDLSFQAPWTAAGFPALSIPSGLSRSGLPMGVQLVSAPFAETALLASGVWCERVLGFELTPPNGVDSARSIVELSS